LELNYGVLKWLEVGGYIGFMNYEWLTEELWEANEDFYPNYPDAFAPTFGVSANIQILPLFVKKPNCKWDFYIPVRYGGCILFRHGGKYEVPQRTTPIWDNKRANAYAYIEINDNKYRHEYGAGLGGAYYIKNIIGFYAEVMGGQFSYWPELVRSPYNIRVGLAAKFKKKTCTAKERCIFLSLYYKKRAKNISPLYLEFILSFIWKLFFTFHRTLEFPVPMEV